MDVTTLVAEVLFVLLFIATFVEFVRHRDPVRRDIMLVFSGLALLLVAGAWKTISGETPLVLAVVGGVLLLLQPVFTLHLARLVRGLPTPIFYGAAALVVVSVAAAAIAAQVPVISVVARASFIGVEILAAVYLLLEARRRQGPASARMAIAALATGLLAAAYISSSVSSASPEIKAAAAPVTTVLVLLATIGYFIAFLAPRPVRRVWHASAMVEYGQSLLVDPTRSVEAIWRGLTDFAATMSAGAAAVYVKTDTGSREIASTGLDDTDTPATLADLDGLVADHRGPELDIRIAGSLATRLAARCGARFVSAVSLPLPDGGGSAVLVILNRHRTLSHDADLELLRSLGVQTAIMAERRAFVADQEQLAQRLATTVEALHAAAAAKSDFLASMSHELRTPLSAILGFSDLMRREEATGGSVTVPLEWVEHIHTGGSHLLTLINDVLDLAKVEAGRLDLHPEAVDLGAAIAESVSGLRPLAERKRLNVEVRASNVSATVDRGRFRQIMYNLLSNAIKYTPDEGTIRVEATGNGSEVRVAVIDTGIGIDTADQQRVFEEFRQVGDPRTREPGTGLGLALTRRLVEAHGGTVELESALGMGSRFTVALPVGDLVGDRAEQGTDDVAVAGPARASLNIILVEDDPSAVRLLREYLRTTGYVLRVASDGEMALEMARAQRPDAVLLDVLLPGLDGWEVLRRLKADPDLGDVPVVIVTVVDEREVGLALGAVDYLLKPVKRERLLACLARVVGTSSPQGATSVVLAVDDEPAGTDLVRAALAPAGYRVITAAGGREALARLRTEHVDVVVCDLVMPGMDGFAVIAAMRDDPRMAEIPIVVCTAHDINASDRERLRGQVLGIVHKGTDARDGLRAWLGRTAAAIRLDGDIRPADA